MRLGFITSCFPTLDLAQVVERACHLGYDALEVAVWPRLGDRPFTATHIDVDGLDQGNADDIRALLGDLELSALAYYDNNLHPDPVERAAVNAHLLRCVEAAALLGVELVGTFIGRHRGLSVRENVQQAREIFAPVVDRAGELGVKVMIENCVMEGWHPDGYPGNLAYSPELWEQMFDWGLYLNYDLSHLVWMGIDPVAVITPYLDRVPHWQAKDIEVFPELRNRYGWPGRTVEREHPWDVGWWRYRVPGLGEVDWRRLVDRFYEGGYQGVVSVEHEDPVWGGTPERVAAGLDVAQRTLRPLLVQL